MSMLGRYKKQGGFAQLLNLMETCSPAKREQLLKIIDQEDASWASLLRAKILTLEKVFSWDVMVIAEIVPHVPSRILAIALKGAPEGSLEKATQIMDPMKRREVEQFYGEVSPQVGEIEAARVKMVTKIREMEQEGQLQLHKIDPVVSATGAKAA